MAKSNRELLEEIHEAILGKSGQAEAHVEKKLSSAPETLQVGLRVKTTAGKRHRGDTGVITEALTNGRWLVSWPDGDETVEKGRFLRVV